jgi:hypothetical protein
VIIRAGWLSSTSSDCYSRDTRFESRRGHWLSWLEDFSWFLLVPLHKLWDTQNCWVSGHCPLSGILNSRNYNVSETESVSVHKRGGGNTYTTVQWLRLALSQGPNWVGISPLTWGRKQNQFPKHRVFWYLEFLTSDKDPLSAKVGTNLVDKGRSLGRYSLLADSRHRVS